jgi:lipid A 4'-phosphatase
LSVSDQHARLGLRAAILASIFLGLIPAWWPELDLKVAAAFYDDTRGFANHDLPVITVIYHGINWLARTAFLALAFGLAGGMAFQASRNFGQLPTSAPRPLRPPRVRQAMACALLSLVIGPGLLVNLVLKENVGRARPIQVEAFGGNRQFSPALRQAHECERNCAFVSGHAAVGFWFATGYAISRRRNRAWLWVGTLAGFTVGLIRIVAGGHWFSDIAFAMTFTLVGIGLAYLLAYRPALRWRLAKARFRTSFR